jgi:hypothetical protein
MLPRNATVAKWDSSQALFLRPIMEDFKDPSVNEIVAMCSAQSAKTETLIALLLYVLAEDPGPILWVTVNQAEARKIARMRIMPAIDLCAPVVDKIPDGRYDRTTTTIYFPGAPLVIAGADSPANLQSTPYRYIFLDEARSWKPGALEMVSKRTRSFPHSYKKVVVSTPDMANDPLHRLFLGGSQQHWHSTCPDCGAEFELDWGDRDSAGGLKWEESEATIVDGKIDYDAVLESVHFKCPGCEKKWFDTPRDRKALSNNGKWVAYNTKFAKNVRSYTWNALLPWWPSWKNQVKEFLDARAASQIGSWKAMKDHYNETRGQVWTDAYRFENDLGTLDSRVEKYDPTDFEAMGAAAKVMGNSVIRVGNFVEARRFLTIDVQGKGGRHYWGVVRSWEKGGMRTRYLDSAKLWTVEEIKKFADRWSVSPDNVIIDAGHWASEVYQLVIASGNRWKAFKGEPREFFTESTPTGPQKRIFTVSKIDPAQGTARQGQMGTIPLYLFSKPSTCDILDAYIHGIIPGWEIPETVPEDYKLQVTAYYRHTSIDKKGNEKIDWRSKREEHLADCERMQIVAATATGIR